VWLYDTLTSFCREEGHATFFFLFLCLNLKLA
jgi:hypothetical protein